MAVTEHPKLDAFGLVVDDMARSLAFYRALGLAIADGAESEPHVDVELGGGMRLMFDTIDTVRSFNPSWQPPSGGNARFGLAFRCASPADVDATHDRLVGVGAVSHKPPWDAPWGQRYAMLRDPDGNGVDLYADAPDES